MSGERSQGNMLTAAVVAGCLETVADAPSPGDDLRVLLADALACMQAAPVDRTGRALAADPPPALGEVSCRLSKLCLRAHAADLDDIYWPTATHIGSVIWPVVLDLGARYRSTGAELARAARTGYQIAGYLSALFGPRHAAQWHVTATAGMIGAAASAAVVMRLDTAALTAACGHAAAMAGGLGQSILERSATGAFHRSAAAVTGALAAEFAATGAEPPAAILEGPRGLLTLLAPDRPASAPAQVDIIAHTSVRIFPVNGFAQGAVQFAARLGRESRARSDMATPTRLTVHVAKPVADATSGDPGGAWWDLRGAVAAAWLSGDPFNLAPTDASTALRSMVTVEPDRDSVLTTSVTATTPTGTTSAGADTPPGYRPSGPDGQRLLRDKWNYLLADEPLRLADRILDRGIDSDDVDTLLRHT